MSDVKDREPTVEDLTTITGEEPVTGYDEWFVSTVKRTLERKARGEVTYKPMDAVFQKLGL